VSVIASLDLCESDAATCAEQIIASVSSYPIYDTDALTLTARTSSGNLIFEVFSPDGQPGVLEYDLSTGDLGPCLSCFPEEPPPNEVCTPVPA
jgi:hypothetical protein